MQPVPSVIYLNFFKINPKLTTEQISNNRLYISKAAPVNIVFIQLELDDVQSKHLPENICCESMVS
jgi:hypothetical protein